MIESRFDSYKSKGILFFANSLKNAPAISHIQLQWTFTKHALKRRKKYWVIVEKSLPQKKKNISKKFRRHVFAVYMSN